MKKFNLFLISLAILSFTAQAQILNPSFESWESDLPVSWVSLGIIFGNSITQTSDAFDGNSAVKLEIKENFSLAFPALLVTSIDGAVNNGHPVSAKYTKFKGHFKLDLKGAALFGISILMYDKDGLAIGGGALNLNNSSANWIPIEVPIDYYDDKVPSYVYIQFALADSSDNDLTTIGSTAKIDHLSLDGAVTSIESNDNTPLSFSLDQNYPNPFNPSTTIRYSIPNESEVSLSVYDALGAKVEELYNGAQTAGNFEVSWDASNFTSGVYFLRMNAVSIQNSKRFTDVKKLILLK